MSPGSPPVRNRTFVFRLSSECSTIELQVDSGDEGIRTPANVPVLQTGALPTELHLQMSILRIELSYHTYKVWGLTNSRYAHKPEAGFKPATMSSKPIILSVKLLRCFLLNLLYHKLSGSQIFLCIIFCTFIQFYAKPSGVQ